MPLMLDEYQKQALTTAFYPERKKLGGLIYTILKLNGEAGEVAEKMGKLIRDHDSFMSDENKILFLKELGDVLWYIAAAADELGSSLEDVAYINLAKLADRKQRNKISGSGDER